MPVYLITYLLVFWVPVFVMGFLLWKKLDAPTKKAFWITIGIMTVATTVMEYVYLWLDVWSFSEAIDPLLGIWIGKAPIEEFVFWYGATPLFLLLYLTFNKSLRNKSSGSNG